MKTNYLVYDSKNMFDIIFNFAQQLAHAMTIGAEFTLKNSEFKPRAIIFAGVGGSAIAGDIVTLLTSTTSPIPLFCIRSYTLPAWVDETTLVICLSYSGNTEETLSLFHDAVSHKATIIGITSGGTLQEELIKHNFETIVIPNGLPPRASLGYLLVPLLYVMHKLNLVNTSFKEELSHAINTINQQRTVWSQEDDGNQALTIARTIYKSFPLIYGQAGKTDVIAKRWASQLAENSKMLSAADNLPELNHNAIVGWHNNSELLKNMGVLWLIDQDMHPRIEKQLAISKTLIQPYAAYQLEISNAGKSVIERTLNMIYLGDWVSFWCAILHQTDPTPVESINRLKKQLSN